MPSKFSIAFRAVQKSAGQLHRNLWDEVGHAAAEDLSDVIVETVSSHMERPNVDVVFRTKTSRSYQKYIGLF